MSPEILITKARDYQTPAEAFYQTCNRPAALEPGDDLVIARHNGAITGIVRLCQENETFTLRTMQIHPQAQRQGLGLIILKAFENLVEVRRIHEIFCMPYTHLESFYATIGFQQIELPSAPAFLQKRQQDFQLKNPTSSTILMKRVTSQT